MSELTWADESRVERLKELWANGHSTSWIAADLGNGITRNSVIGKIHRLGLSEPMVKIARAPKPLKEPKQPKEQKSRVCISKANGNTGTLRLFESASMEMAPLRCVEIVPLHLSLNDLTDETCKYPYGDGPVFTFCGHPPFKGSYCGPHRALVYTAPRNVSEAERERRRLRCMNMNRQSARAMGVPA